MSRFSGIIIKYKKLVFSLTIAVILLFGYFAKNLKINPNINTYLPKTDKVVATLNHIGTEYGGNFLAIVVLEAGDVFDQAVIGEINLLTNEFKNIAGVSSVTSLTNIIDLKKGEGGIEVGKLIDEYNLPGTATDIEKLKSYVLSKNMYRGHIVSDDSKTTLIICRLGEDADQIKTVRQIQETLNKINPKSKIYFAGVPFQVMEINKIIRSDLKLLIPIVGLVIGLLLLLSFRSFLGVAMPLVSVFASIVITLGIMSMFKIPLTIISNIIPVILVTTGSAYSIHIINKFYEHKNGRSEQARDALKDVFVPVMLAALTTMAGFISFVFNSYLTMIKEFGVFTSIGIFFAFLVSVTFVPAALAIISKRKTNKSIINPPESKGHARVMDKVAQLIMKNVKWILTLAMIIAGAGIIGAPKISRVSNMLDYFKPKSQIRTTEEIMTKKFGGSVPIQILVKGDIQAPVVLNEMKRFEDFLVSQPDVSNPQSIADLIEEMSYAIGEGKIIPETKDKVTNLWFLLEGEETVNQMVNQDKSEAVIQAMVAGIETKEGKIMLKEIQTYIDKIDTNYCSFTLTGSPLIYDHLDKSLLKSQVQSLAIALLLVLVCLVIMLGSFWGGAVGLVPILLTLLVVFGFMGFTKIPLDVATVLVGSVSIGIGIDYSIHFLARFRKEIKSGKNKYDALLETLRTTGRAILINVITVTAGFLVLIFANLIPLQRFGILVAITMVSSGISAITVLPAIILISKRKLINDK